MSSLPMITIEKAQVLGHPRIGAQRQLKKAQEAYWRKKISVEALQIEAKTLREEKLKGYKSLGFTEVTIGDFSFYDHILDTTFLLSCLPKKYETLAADGNDDTLNLRRYFAAARGYQDDKSDLPALEMTKWFNTNYHYLVPELSEDQTFTLNSSKIEIEIAETVAAGLTAVPTLVAPITYLLLSKGVDNPLKFLPKLTKIYQELFKKLETFGIKKIQLDEPSLILDLDATTKASYKQFYQDLADSSSLEIYLNTYFEAPDYDILYSLPVKSVHIDLTCASLEDFYASLSKADENLHFSLGLIDGRNIWKNDLNKSVAIIDKVISLVGQARVGVATSCSLLHSPVDLSYETKLDTRIKTHMAFAKQKLNELVILSNYLADKSSITAELNLDKQRLNELAASDFINDAKVQARYKALTEKDLVRKSSFDVRRKAQIESLKLPEFPTTTIGSFPQTAEIRKARLENKRGDLDDASYKKFLQEETAKCIAWQEEIGLDVLVHGEFERNDMVEYFGENLKGMAFTENGWVQSYGSRCVKPPIIYGDVSRSKPMTVDWSSYAVSVANKPMKAMLTGPITILKWSFVRQDQPLEVTCKQIALALRDEVQDLETAGLQIIQIDEAAMREALPIKKQAWADYLRWSVEAFRISSSGVADKTQIHTHMCYSEFNEILHSIIAMDADVISIEASRSKLDILEAFKNNNYPNEIGLGVYDIHSPRVPKDDEMLEILKAAKPFLAAWQIWVNPDCGLKTRAWSETKAALINMVAAAKKFRNLS